jgi:hypothetical protein
VFTAPVRGLYKLSFRAYMSPRTTSTIGWERTLLGFAYYPSMLRHATEYVDPEICGQIQTTVVLDKGQSMAAIFLGKVTNQVSPAEYAGRLLHAL